MSAWRTRPFTCYATRPGVRQGAIGPTAIRVGADDIDAQRPCRAIPSPRWWAGHVTVRRAAICLTVTIIRLRVVLRASVLTSRITKNPLHGQPLLVSDQW